jgi:NADPH-dependent curcumin reductase CurA
MKSRRIVLASRPTGAPTEANFRLETEEIRPPGEGELLLKTLYLSLDPYMRGRMSPGPSYAAPVEVDSPMTGGTVGEVVESRVDGFAPGDIVLAFTGWQEYSVVTPKGLRKLDPTAAPVSTALGILGMPGLTACVGLLHIGQPKPGETVVVSAASGAVGSAVGQIAKIKGCRAVGIAGGKTKCDYVVNELGFDACVDHHSASFEADLKAACPSGIDIYFENVGGTVFEAVLPLLNQFARVPVCGLISQYNASELPDCPDKTPLVMRTVLTKRLTLRGFIVSDYADQGEECFREMAGWMREGRLKYREDIVDGLENAPGALIGLLHGKNFGKMLIRF